VVCASTIPKPASSLNCIRPLPVTSILTGKRTGARRGYGALPADAMVMMLTGAGETETKLKRYEAG
jgi:hypothetical protein